MSAETPTAAEAAWQPDHTYVVGENVRYGGVQATVAAVSYDVDDVESLGPIVSVQLPQCCRETTIDRLRPEAAPVLPAAVQDMLTAQGVQETLWLKNVAWKYLTGTDMLLPTRAFTRTSHLRTDSTAPTSAVSSDPNELDTDRWQTYSDRELRWALASGPVRSHFGTQIRRTLAHRAVDSTWPHASALRRDYARVIEEDAADTAVQAALLHIRRVAPLSDHAWMDGWAGLLLADSDVADTPDLSAVFALAWSAAVATDTHCQFVAYDCEARNEAGQRLSFPPCATFELSPRPGQRRTALIFTDHGLRWKLERNSAWLATPLSAFAVSRADAGPVQAACTAPQLARVPRDQALPELGELFL